MNGMLDTKSTALLNSTDDTERIVHWLVEKHISRILPKTRTTKLSGGISSEAFLVESDDPTQTTTPKFVLRIFRHPDFWWKVEKEASVRALTDDPSLFPNLVSLGFDEIFNCKVGHVIAEYSPGLDLDAFLIENYPQDSSKKASTTSLLTSFAHKLAKLHSYTVSEWGQIGLPDQQYDNWKQFVSTEFENELDLIQHLDAKIQVGSASVKQLKKMVPDLRGLLKKHRASLQLASPRLCHGDARFANFVVNADQMGQPQVTTIIDLESALGGDPEIDIAYIENWLHFADYPTLIPQVKEVFIKEYEKSQHISDQYEQKRLIYHAWRSLSYLKTVLVFDLDEFLNASANNQTYIERHFEILATLSSDLSLDTIAMPRLK
jgi:aminoglycoside phosphotransferase (APT) family kinase protein